MPTLEIPDSIVVLLANMKVHLSLVDVVLQLWQKEKTITIFRAQIFMFLSVLPLNRYFTLGAFTVFCRLL